MPGTRSRSAKGLERNLSTYDKMTLPRLLFFVVVLALATFPSPIKSEEKPKPDRATLEAEFKKAEASRASLPENTKERAEAAKSAMQLASDIGWLEFDSSKFDAAATWFATSAKFKEESYLNARGYWEEYLRATAVELDNKVVDQIKTQRAQLATADASKKPIIQQLIHGWEKLRYLNRYNAVTMLEQITRDNNDDQRLLKYYEQELEIRQAEMAYLRKVSAPKNELDEKTAQVATALERVASGQAGLALFDKAEKNGLEALSLRRGLPEQMGERKLEESLISLAQMYAFNLGDLKKARDYYEQALGSLEAAAAVKKKALEEDRYYTPEQKAALSKEDLAKHEEFRAQTRDMQIALDAMSRAMALMSLGEISQEEGNLKIALATYEKALKVGDDLPKGGYMNVFEMFRARIRGRVMGDMASLHAESGEVELALKELNDTIALKRSIGQDEWTAQSLIQAADMTYQKGDLAVARQFVTQARQIFAAAHKLTSVVNATNLLGILARDEEKFDEAAKYAEEALILARKTGNFGAVSGSARSFASIRLKQNKSAEAKLLIEEAEAADAKTGSLGDRIATLGIRGEILEASGANDKALEAYKEAVKLTESVRATAASESAYSDVKRNYRPYERIVRILIKLNRLEDAFDYLNRAKSKKLQDILPPSSLKTENKRDQQSLDKAAELETKKKVVETQLAAEQAKPNADEAVVKNLKQVAAATEADYREVVEDIKTANPDWEKSMTVKPLQLVETKNQIPDGVVFLQYAPLGDQLYVFVVTNKTVKIYTPDVKPEELKKKVLALRKQITSGEAGPPLTKNLCGLYDMLIAS